MAEQQTERMGERVNELKDKTIEITHSEHQQKID